MGFLYTKRRDVKTPRQSTEYLLVCSIVCSIIQPTVGESTDSSKVMNVTLIHTILNERIHLQCHRRNKKGPFLYDLPHTVVFRK